MEISGEKFVADEFLDHLQNIPAPSLFFSANRGFIVGIEVNEQMNSYSGSRKRIDLKPASPKKCIISTERTPDS